MHNGEGYSARVNKRADPCSVGKVAREIKNKPSSWERERRGEGAGPHPPFLVSLRACSDDAGKHPSEKTSLPSGP